MKYLSKMTIIGMIVCGFLGCSVRTTSAVAIQEVNIDSLPEWGTIHSDQGGTLLLSDSPEMVSDDGILYADKVNGNVRLFFYHVNASNTAKRMDVVLENRGPDAAHVTVNRSSLGGPGYIWMQVGKEAVTSYLAGSPACQFSIPPNAAAPLAASISDTAVLPNMLINGIFDFHTDHPITVKVIMMPLLAEGAEFAKTARILPADSVHLRGTFQEQDREIEPMTVYDPARDGAVALTIADGGIDPFVRGIDATDGSQVVNYGNYGIAYRIALPSQNTGRFACYLAPLGGIFAGAVDIRMTDAEWGPISIPREGVYFGNNNATNFAFLGTFDSGEPLSILFSPPGGSNLPVRMIILPQ